MRLTCKQMALLSTIAKGNDDGSSCDLDQVLESLPYSTTKQSLQFSIRALIKHELIIKADSENRRGRQRTVLEPTPLGRHYTGTPGGAAAVTVSEEEDALEAALFLV